MTASRHRSNPGLHRKGFTLSELLVAITLVGLLVGLTLPAVQSIRESSRRIACANNLREIALAVAGFQSGRRHLPAGTLGFDEQFEFDLYRHWLNPGDEFHWKRAQHTSFAVQILPWLQHVHLYRKIDPSLLNPEKFLDESDGYDAELFSWFGDTRNFVSIATTDVPQLYCPTDNIRDVQSRDHIVFAGSQPTYVKERDQDAFAWIALTLGPYTGEDEVPLGVYDNAMDKRFAMTNYLGCSGAHAGGESPDPERVPFTGIMSSRKNRRLNEVTDGLSNTVLIGETIGSIESERFIGGQNWAFGGLATIRGLVPWMLETHKTRWHWKQLGSPSQASAYGFGSRHSHVVNFSFGDGSVRSIARDVDWFTLYQLGGMADGAVVNPLDP